VPESCFWSIFPGQEYVVYFFSLTWFNSVYFCFIWLLIKTHFLGSVAALTILVDVDFIGDKNRMRRILEQLQTLKVRFTTSQSKISYILKMIWEWNRFILLFFASYLNISPIHIDLHLKLKYQPYFIKEGAIQPSD